MGFLFSRLFLWFLKIIKNFEKNTKNCFVDLSTYSKDTSRGLVPFYLALNVLPRGYSSPRWVFYFPDFFDGFREKSKILKKKYKNCFVDFSTYSKDTSGGWYHSIQHWMYFLGSIAPHAGFFVFPTFFDDFWKKSKNLKKTQKLFCRFLHVW